MKVLLKKGFDKRKKNREKRLKSLKSASQVIVQEFFTKFFNLTFFFICYKRYKNK